MNLGRLWLNGQNALVYSEELEQDGRPGPAKLFENAGLFCLGLGMAGALRSVWGAAERRGRLREARAARAAADVHGSGQMSVEAFAAAATAAYLQGWEDAGQEFHEEMPNRIRDAMRDAERDRAAAAELADAPAVDG